MASMMLGILRNFVLHTWYMLNGGLYLPWTESFLVRKLYKKQKRNQLRPIHIIQIGYAHYDYKRKEQANCSKKVNSDAQGPTYGGRKC